MSIRTKKLGTHVFVFNPTVAPDVSLILETSIFSEGWEGPIHTSQKLILGSATINIANSPLTPENLRKLADELEHANRATKEALKLLEVYDRPDGTVGTVTVTKGTMADMIGDCN